jgi:hypothetical protein
MKRFLLYILFCLPVVVSAQDSLNSLPDTTRTPYFESICFSGGLLAGPNLERRYYDSQTGKHEDFRLYQLPLLIQLEKRIGKKQSISVGVCRIMADNSYNNWKFFPDPNFVIVDLEGKFGSGPPFSNWTILMKYNQALIVRKFSMGISAGFGLEYGNSWYLGTSLHGGINAAYRLSPGISITLDAGARTMYGFSKFNYSDYLFRDGSPYYPVQASYVLIGAKWFFNKIFLENNKVEKALNAKMPLIKPGFGLSYLFSKREKVLYNKVVDNPDDFYNFRDMHPTPKWDMSAFPHIQINTITQKLNMHSLGFGFTKIYLTGAYNTSEVLKSYRFYYQYDFPVLISKYRTSYFYSGLLSCSRIEDSYFNGRARGVAGLVTNTTKSLSLRTNMFSLGIPIGLRKQIATSGVWIDLGINIDILSYAKGKYIHAYFQKSTGKEAIQSGDIETFIFYPQNIQGLNKKVASNIFIKIIFL